MSPMLPHFSDIVWPDAASYWIGNACVPLCLLAGPHAFAPIDREDGAALLDMLVEDGRIARLDPAGAVGADQRPRVDLRGRQVWPMLVDVHTHLDRGHTVVRSPNASGMFGDALKATAADRLKWTHDDLIARMDFGLRCSLCARRLSPPHPSRFGAGAGGEKLACVPRDARGMEGSGRLAGGFAHSDRFFPR